MKTIYRYVKNTDSSVRCPLFDIVKTIITDNGCNSKLVTVVESKRSAEFIVSELNSIVR